MTLTLTERLKLNHPNAVWRKWKAAFASEPRDEHGEPKPTLCDSVANLSEENAEKDRKIADLEERLAAAGDDGLDHQLKRWDPEHIGRVIVLTAGKMKARQIAKAIAELAGGLKGQGESTRGDKADA
jgi:hypothetical protein